MPATPTTWTTLLAHWTLVAQRAVALPRTPEGDRLRAAVAHLIALQAVALALDHSDALPADEAALGLDRAEVALRDHGGALRAIYESELPESVAVAFSDAKSALRAARSAGLGWVVTTDALTVGHPAELVAALLAGGFDGDLLLPAPGAALFKTTPCAFVRAPDATPIDDSMLAVIGLYLGQKERLARGPIRTRPRQVYRQFDFARGGPVRDLVAKIDAPDIPGQPLLLWAIKSGKAQSVPLPPRHQPPVRAVPVVLEE